MTTADANKNAAPRGLAWPELDLLRGLAVIAMIANHAVAGWHFAAADIDDTERMWFFLGGFAPVLFFFTTGFGSGLQSLRPQGAGQHRYGFYRKLAILVVADQFILWRWGTRVLDDVIFGLDFLGFIALSTAVVEPLRRMRRATEVALLAAGAVLAVRFVISPWILPDAIDATDMRWFGVWTGRAAEIGIAYPPLPWLVYPLLGFALGRTIGARRTLLQSRPTAVYAVLGALAVCGIGASRWLEAQGFDVSRYGIHSLGYLPLAIAALAIGAALAWWLGQASERRGGLFVALERAVSIRGLASLAVVPVHFAIVFAVGLYLRPAPGALATTLGVLAILPACFAGGRITAKLAEAIERRGGGPVGWIVGAVVVGFCAFALWWPLADGPISRHVSAHSAQLLLCGLLVWSPTKARPTRS